MKGVGRMVKVSQHDKIAGVGSGQTQPDLVVYIGIAHSPVRSPGLEPPARLSPSDHTIATGDEEFEDIEG